MPEQALPSPDRIQQMLIGFWVSRTLFTGVELGIFDELSKGPASAEVLAYRMRLHPRALERLLNALVALGLLRRDNGRYANTLEADTYLVKGRPTYLGGPVEHMARLHWRLWEYLPDAIRENTPRVKQVFGPSFDLFQALAADPQRLRAFVQGITLTLPTAQEIVQAYDFTPHHLLLDVGGGSGALCIAAVQRYPHLRAIVLEQPLVAAVARENLEAHGVAGRVTVVEGDFFRKETMPSGADVVALGWVLHDLTPSQARQVLRNCYDVLAPGGAILVCEKVLDEGRTGPLLTALLNLHDLVSTGGEEHTASEYQQWLEEAGFTDCTVRILHGPRDLIVGWKR
ncbi:MAG: acetylserotonin O-methyltransferase [Dehalococcoidia bacterium]|nr:acetylserotonin O-methyltransferase [Dehalococcoidia bacterium]MDW8119567.1 class I SAM-dependent methyltransferase [Chloroflexota bacterium]